MLEDAIDQRGAIELVVCPSHLLGVLHRLLHLLLVHLRKLTQTVPTEAETNTSRSIEVSYPSEIIFQLIVSLWCVGVVVVESVTHRCGGCAFELVAFAARDRLLNFFDDATVDPLFCVLD